MLRFFPLPRLGFLVLTAALGLITDRASIAGDSWVDLLGENAHELWRGYQGESWPVGWELADGVLSRNAVSDDLMTAAEYNDFDLRLVSLAGGS
jgi:hypothetical protein